MTRGGGQRAADAGDYPQLCWAPGPVLRQVSTVQYSTVQYSTVLDQYFGSVCELDIIYNYEKAYFILDEYLMAGEILETSKKSILNAIRLQDFLQEEETPQGLFEDAGLG